MVQEDDEHVLHGPTPLQPLPGASLGRIVYDSLLANPNTHDAMVDAVTGRAISYREILATSCALAERLRSCGYGKDTVFSICGENCLEFFVPVFSALFMGAVMAPINHFYTEVELEHTIAITRPKVLFCSKAVVGKFLNLRGTSLGFVERIVVIDGVGGRGAEGLEEFIRRGDVGGFRVLDVDPEEQVAFVLCSSGTTGLPKGVMVTHRNVTVRYMHTIDPRCTLRQDNHSFFGILPFFHAYGLITNLFALVLGEKVVLLSKFEEIPFLKAIQDHRISTLYLAPPLILFLAKSPLVDKFDLSGVKEVVSGAAPLNKHTEELVKKRLNIETVRQGYGLTEATLATHMIMVGSKKFGSSGKVVPFMSCKVRNPETGKSLPSHHVGEICLKGPMVMKGYFGNPEATRNSFTSDGWLLTGDLGYYDEEGFFFIVDRLKELIKYKGFQVAPAELEAILLTNPKIRDVGVVGVPREDVGELPLALVVKHQNVTLTEKEVEEFVSKRVSPQKRLRGGVVFVEGIPRNPSGKILRRELRKIIQNLKAKM